MLNDKNNYLPFIFSSIEDIFPKIVKQVLSAIGLKTSDYLICNHTILSKILYFVSFKHITEVSQIPKLLARCKIQQHMCTVSITVLKLTSGYSTNQISCAQIIHNIYCNTLFCVASYSYSRRCRVRQIIQFYFILFEVRTFLSDFFSNELSFIGNDIITHD